MTKILITGANSYIGQSFSNWIEKNTKNVSIATLEVKGDAWTKESLAGIDAIFHVAGIAHIKETRENAELYYQVNRDLTVQLAEKAKREGVGQFVFLSSMSVYGKEAGKIDDRTPLIPNSNYGKSKMQAEHFINQMADEHFLVTILRPPMIYGPGCKGNYPKLAKLALKTPIFPDSENRRSMLYIDNLCSYVWVLIRDKRSGLFLPQNSEYVNTGDLVQKIALAHDKKLTLTKLFTPLIRILNVSVVEKVFGSLYYEKDTENRIEYTEISFADSIKITEKSNANSIDQ